MTSVTIVVFVSSGCLFTSSCWAAGRCCWWKPCWPVPSLSARCFSSHSCPQQLSKPRHHGISLQQSVKSRLGWGFQTSQDDLRHYISPPITMQHQRLLKNTRWRWVSGLVWCIKQANIQATNWYAHEFFQFLFLTSTWTHGRKHALSG